MSELRTRGAGTGADEIAAEVESIAREVLRILPLSRTEPHVFAEQKDAAARRLGKLAARVRNSFGGAPASFEPGTIAVARPFDFRERRVRVEVRRRVAM